MAPRNAKADKGKKAAPPPASAPAYWGNLSKTGGLNTHDDEEELKKKGKGKAVPPSQGGPSPSRPGSRNDASRKNNTTPGRLEKPSAPAMLAPITKTNGASSAFSKTGNDSRQAAIPQQQQQQHSFWKGGGLFGGPTKEKPKLVQVTGPQSSSLSSNSLLSSQQSKGKQVAANTRYPAAPERPSHGRTVSETTHRAPGGRFTPEPPRLLGRSATPEVSSRKDGRLGGNSNSTLNSQSSSRGFTQGHVQNRSEPTVQLRAHSPLRQNPQTSSTSTSAFPFSLSSSSLSKAATGQHGAGPAPKLLSGADRSISEPNRVGATSAPAPRETPRTTGSLFSFGRQHSRDPSPGPSMNASTSKLAPAQNGNVRVDPRFARDDSSSKQGWFQQQQVQQQQQQQQREQQEREQQRREKEFRLQQQRRAQQVQEEQQRQQREQQLRLEQQAREQQAREEQQRRAQQIREEQQRQEQQRQEQQLRLEQQAREEQQRRAQQIREEQQRQEQQRREQQLRLEQQRRDQQQREQQEREQKQREQQAREQQLREQKLREEQLRLEQQAREQEQQRAQQIREQQEREQKQREQKLREQQERQRQLLEQQQREQRMREQRQREQQEKAKQKAGPVPVPSRMEASQPDRKQPRLDKDSVELGTADPVLIFRVKDVREQQAPQRPSLDERGQPSKAEKGKQPMVPNNSYKPVIEESRQPQHGIRGQIHNLLQSGKKNDAPTRHRANSSLDVTRKPAPNNPDVFKMPSSSNQSGSSQPSQPPVRYFDPKTGFHTSASTVQQPPASTNQPPSSSGKQNGDKRQKDELFAASRMRAATHGDNSEQKSPSRYAQDANRPADRKAAEAPASSSAQLLKPVLSVEQPKHRTRSSDEQQATTTQQRDNPQSRFNGMPGAAQQRNAPSQPTFLYDTKSTGTASNAARPGSTRDTVSNQHVPESHLDQVKVAANSDLRRGPKLDVSLDSVNLKPIMVGLDRRDMSNSANVSERYTPQPAKLPQGREKERDGQERSILENGQRSFQPSEISLAKKERQEPAQEAERYGNHVRRETTTQPSLDYSREVQHQAYPTPVSSSKQPQTGREYEGRSDKLPESSTLESRLKAEKQKPSFSLFPDRSHKENITTSKAPEKQKQPETGLFASIKKDLPTLSGSAPTTAKDDRKPDQVDTVPQKRPDFIKSYTSPIPKVEPRNSSAQTHLESRPIEAMPSTRPKLVPSVAYEKASTSSKEAKSAVPSLPMRDNASLRAAEDVLKHRDERETKQEVLVSKLAFSLPLTADSVSNQLNHSLSSSTPAAASTPTILVSDTSLKGNVPFVSKPQPDRSFVEPKASLPITVASTSVARQPQYARPEEPSRQNSASLKHSASIEAPRGNPVPSKMLSFKDRELAQSNSSEPTSTVIADAAKEKPVPLTADLNSQQKPIAVKAPKVDWGSQKQAEASKVAPSTERTTDFPSTGAAIKPAHSRKTSTERSIDANLNSASMHKHKPSTERSPPIQASSAQVIITTEDSWPKPVTTTHLGVGKFVERWSIVDDITEKDLGSEKPSEKPVMPEKPGKSVADAADVEHKGSLHNWLPWNKKNKSAATRRQGSQDSTSTVRTTDSQPSIRNGAAPSTSVKTHETRQPASSEQRVVIQEQTVPLTEKGPSASVVCPVDQHATAKPSQQISSKDSLPVALVEVENASLVVPSLDRDVDRDDPKAQTPPAKESEGSNAALPSGWSHLNAKSMTATTKPAYLQDKTRVPNQFSPPLPSQEEFVNRMSRNLQFRVGADDTASTPGPSIGRTRRTRNRNFSIHGSQSGFSIPAIPTIPNEFEADKQDAVKGAETVKSVLPSEQITPTINPKHEGEKAIDTKLPQVTVNHEAVEVVKLARPEKPTASVPEIREMLAPDTQRAVPSIPVKSMEAVQTPTIMAHQRFSNVPATPGKMLDSMLPYLAGSDDMSLPDMDRKSQMVEALSLPSTGEKDKDQLLCPSPSTKSPSPVNTHSDASAAGQRNEKDSSTGDKTDDENKNEPVQPSKLLVKNTIDAFNTSGAPLRPSTQRSKTTPSSNKGLAVLQATFSERQPQSLFKGAQHKTEETILDSQEKDTPELEASQSNAKEPQRSSSSRVKRDSEDVVFQATTIELDRGVPNQRGSTAEEEPKIAPIQNDNVPETFPRTVKTPNSESESTPIPSRGLEDQQRTADLAPKPVASQSVTNLAAAEPSIAELRQWSPSPSTSRRQYESVTFAVLQESDLATQQAPPSYEDATRDDREARHYISDVKRPEPSAIDKNAERPVHPLETSVIDKNAERPVHPLELRVIDKNAERPVHPLETSVIDKNAERPVHPLERSSFNLRPHSYDPFKYDAGVMFDDIKKNDDREIESVRGLEPSQEDGLANSTIHKGKQSQTYIQDVSDGSEPLAEPLIQGGKDSQLSPVTAVPDGASPTLVNTEIGVSNEASASQEPYKPLTAAYKGKHNVTPPLNNRVPLNHFKKAETSPIRQIETEEGKLGASSTLLPDAPAVQHIYESQEPLEPSQAQALDVGQHPMEGSHVSSTKPEKSVFVDFKARVEPQASQDRYAPAQASVTQVKPQEPTRARQSDEDQMPNSMPTQRRCSVSSTMPMFLDRPVHDATDKPDAFSPAKLTKSFSPALQNQKHDKRFMPVQEYPSIANWLNRVPSPSPSDNHDEPPSDYRSSTELSSHRESTASSCSGSDATSTESTQHSPHQSVETPSSLVLESPIAVNEDKKLGQPSSGGFKNRLRRMFVKPEHDAVDNLSRGPAVPTASKDLKQVPLDNEPAILDTDLAEPRTISELQDSSETGQSYNHEDATGTDSYEMNIPIRFPRSPILAQSRSASTVLQTGDSLSQQDKTVTNPQMYQIPSRIVDPDAATVVDMPRTSNFQPDAEYEETTASVIIDKYLESDAECESWTDRAASPINNSHDSDEACEVFSTNDQDGTIVLSTPRSSHTFQIVPCGDASGLTEGKESMRAVTPQKASASLPRSSSPAIFKDREANRPQSEDFSTHQSTTGSHADTHFTDVEDDDELPATPLVSQSFNNSYAATKAADPTQKSDIFEADDSSTVFEADDEPEDGAITPKESPASVIDQSEPRTANDIQQPKPEPQAEAKQAEEHYDTLPGSHETRLPDPLSADIHKDEESLPTDPADDDSRSVVLVHESKEIDQDSASEDNEIILDGTTCRAASPAETARQADAESSLGMIPNLNSVQESQPEDHIAVLSEDEVPPVEFYGSSNLEAEASPVDGSSESGNIVDGNLDRELPESHVQDISSDNTVVSAPIDAPEEASDHAMTQEDVGSNDKELDEQIPIEEQESSPEPLMDEPSIEEPQHPVNAEQKLIEEEPVEVHTPFEEPSADATPAQIPEASTNDTLLEEEPADMQHADETVVEDESVNHEPAHEDLGAAEPLADFSTEQAAQEEPCEPEPVEEPPQAEPADEAIVEEEVPPQLEPANEMEVIEDQHIDETPINDGPIEETHIEDAPLEELPFNEAPFEETPLDKAPLDEAPGDGAPVEEDTHIEESPLDEVPLDEAPVEEAAYIEEAPIEEAPLDEAPVDEAPLEESPLYEAPVEEDAPIEETPLDEAPLEGVPFDEAHLEQIPIEQDLIEEAPIEEAPDEDLLGEAICESEDAVEPEDEACEALDVLDDLHLDENDQNDNMGHDDAPENFNDENESVIEDREIEVCEADQAPSETEEPINEEIDGAADDACDASVHIGTELGDDDVLDDDVENDNGASVIDGDENQSMVEDREIEELLIEESVNHEDECAAELDQDGSAASDIGKEVDEENVTCESICVDDHGYSNMDGSDEGQRDLDNVDQEGFDAESTNDEWSDFDPAEFEEDPFDDGDFGVEQGERATSEPLDIAINDGQEQSTAAESRNLALDELYAMDIPSMPPSPTDWTFGLHDFTYPTSGTLQEQDANEQQQESEQSSTQQPDAEQSEEDESREPVRVSQLYRHSVDWQQLLASFSPKGLEQAMARSEDGENAPLEFEMSGALLEESQGEDESGSTLQLSPFDANQTTPTATSPLSPRPLETPPLDAFGQSSSHFEENHEDYLDTHLGQPIWDGAASDRLPSPRLEMTTPPPDFALETPETKSPYAVNENNNDDEENENENNEKVSESRSIADSDTASSSRGPQTFEDMAVPRQMNFSPSYAWGGGGSGGGGVTQDDAGECSSFSSSVPRVAPPHHHESRPSLSQRLSGWWTGNGAGSGAGSGEQSRSQSPPPPVPYNNRYGESESSWI